MSDSDETEIENENSEENCSSSRTSKIPWPGVEKYFSFVEEDGDNVLVKCHSCPLKSLSTSKKSPTFVQFEKTYKDWYKL